MARGRRENIYCEVCGQLIGGPVYRAEVDGVEMNLCPSCYVKLSRSGRAVLVKRKKAEARRPQKIVRRVSRSIEAYDIVEDYFDRIREARSSLGWTQSALAQRLRISESMLRKIESGKLKPPLDLAKRIEKVLKIKLLEPVEVEEEEFSAPPDTLTLGDIVVVRRDED